MRILFISYWAFAWCLIVLSNALALRILTESKPENSYFCLWANITEGHTRITFLRNAVDRSYSLLIYTSVWSSDTRQLLKCEIDNNPEDSGKYLSACAEHLESRAEFSFNLSLLLNPDGPCEWNPTAGLNYPLLSDRLQHGNNVEIKSRQKRAWVFPGTLWCGRGSKASGYDQLGMFERADHCCREHDHCRHTIHSFTVNYGVFNSNFYTVSHCECDHRFRECLASVNDTISNMVGYSFFNILQVPCFELTPRRRCVELNWWGKCKVAKVAPYAVFKKPSPFNVTQISEQQAASRKPTVTEGITSSPNRKFLKRPKAKGSSGRCVLTDSPRGDSFRPRRKKWKKCKRNQRPPPTGSSVLQTHLTQTSTQTRGDDITLTTRGAASTTRTKTDVAKRARKGQKKKLPRTKSKARPLLKSTRHSNTTTTTSARPLLKSTRQSTTTTTSAHPLLKSTRQSTTTITTTSAHPLLKSTRKSTTTITTTSARPLLKSTPQSTTTTTSAHPLLKSTRQSTTTTTSAHPLLKSTRQSTTTTTSAHPLLKSTPQSTTTTTSAHPLLKSTRKSTTTTTSAHPLLKSTRQSTTTTTTSAHPLLKSTRQSTTTTTAVSNTKTPKRTKGFRKHHRCRPRSPPRGDSFQPRRKACSETPSQMPTDQPSTTTTGSPAQSVIPSLNTTSSTPRRTSLLPWRKNLTETVPSSKTWTKSQMKMTSYPVWFGDPLGTTNLSTISSIEESVKPDRVSVS